MISGSGQLRTISAISQFVPKPTFVERVQFLVSKSGLEVAVTESPHRRAREWTLEF